MKIIYPMLFLVIFAESIYPVDLEDNLVAYYPFNGNAIDESDNGLNGSVYNATLTQDRFGHPDSAYYFNGSSAYIQVLNNAILDPLSNVTVCAWVKISTLIKYAGIVNNLWDTYSNESGYGLCFDDNSTRIAYIAKTSGTSSWWSSGCYYEPAVDKWTHLVGVYNGSTADIYADGKLIRSITATGSINYSYPNSMWIGKYQDDNESYFYQGSIDDVRIYNKALSATEVYNLYKSEWIFPPDPAIIYSGSGPELIWAAVTNAKKYKVYSSSDPYATFPSASWALEASGITVTNWTDPDTTSTKKFYIVIAVN